MSDEKQIEMLQANETVMAEVCSEFGINYVYFKSKQDAYEHIKLLKEEAKRGSYVRIYKIHLFNAMDYIDFNKRADYTYQKFIGNVRAEIPWLSYPLCYFVIDKFTNLDQMPIGIELALTLSSIVGLGYVLTWLTRRQIDKVTGGEDLETEVFKIGKGAL
jgi:hypothetical protein